MNLVGFQGYLELHQQNIADPSCHISPVVVTGWAGNSSVLHGADKRPGFDSIRHWERLVSNEKLMKFPPRFQYKQVCPFLSAVDTEVK